MEGNCDVCDGTQFEDRDGIRLCVECGTQRDDYMEFQSQEDTSVIDRSRFLYTKKSVDSSETGDPESTIGNAWTSFELFNDILFEWTNALCSIKASAKFRHIVFKLWALYLQRLGVAFLPKQCKRNQICCPSASLCPAKRDVLVLHKKQKSVHSSSLSVRSKASSKSGKIKTEKSELEKLKDKVQKNKVKLEVQGKKKSMLMSQKLAQELNRTIDELDSSRLNGEAESCRRSERLTSKSMVSYKTSGSSSDITMGESGSEYCPAGNDMLSKERKNIVRRNTFVLNWLQQKKSIYTSVSEKINDVDSEDLSGLESDDAVSGVRYLYSGTQSSEGGTSTTRRKRKKMQAQGKRATHNEIRTYKKLQPCHMNLKKLLALVYLACHLSKEEILLADILRWSQEGHIPYCSAHYLIDSDKILFRADLYMFSETLRVPTAREIQKIAGRLAVFLCLQYVPLPPMGNIIDKWILSMNLPVTMKVRVKWLAENFIDWRTQRNYLEIPPIEQTVMAAIIVELKILYGLNDRDEYSLSRIASEINQAISSRTQIELFSWQDWVEYLSRLVWWCCQVDIPTRVSTMGPKAVSHVDARRVAQFFWSDGIWRKKRSTILKDHSVSQTQKLLSLQGMSLEEVMEWQRIFSPSACPLLGLLLEYPNVYRKDQGSDATDMLKVSEELMAYSFKKHMLDWPRQLGLVQGALVQSGSLLKIQVEVKRRPHGAVSKHAKRKREPTCEGVISVPQPWQSYWLCPPLEKVEKSKSWGSLPKSFRWLLSIASHITQTTDEDLYSLISSIERMLKFCQE